MKTSLQRLKKLFSMAIKLYLYCLYALSYTPYYLFFLFSVILVFFSQKENNYLTSASTYFIIFIFLSCIFLFIFLNHNRLLAITKSLVGAPFLDKYFPPSSYGIRAAFPLLLFACTFFIAGLIEYLSIKWFSILEAKQISKMQKEMIELYQSQQLQAGAEMADQAVTRVYEKIPTSGLFKKILDYPLFKKIIDWFDF